MRRLLLSFCLGLVLPTLAGAQGVTATVDRPEATMQDQLLLQVTIEGTRNAEPRLPDDLSNSFRVIPRGTQSQIRVVNGRQSVSLTFNYALVPKQTGTFTIGRVVAMVEGKAYSSQAFQVRIVEASRAGPGSGESVGVFVTAEVSTKTPYVGQQVIYTWRFYRRVQVADAQLIDMPFEGFLVENLGDEIKEYQQIHNGQRYLISEIRRALFPQEDGELTIAPSQLECQVVTQSRRRSRRGSVFDDFFGARETRAMVLATDPITLDVRPLPPAPAVFSGLVGNFEVRGKLSKRALAAGESTTWKLTVAGSGNVQMIGAPKIPEMPAFKIYDEQPTSSVDRSSLNGLRGSRTFAKALVPLEAGELVVPGVSLSYFDPKEGIYRTASTQPIVLAISPGEGQEDLNLTESRGAGGSKVQVRILADDILPIAKGLDAVVPPAFGHRPGVMWSLALALPPMLFFGLTFLERRRRHFAVNVGLRRHREAFGRATRGLGEVEAAAQRGDATEAAQLASRCLREFIGDKVDLEGSAFTPAEAAEQLRDAGVGAEQVEDVRRRLEAFEAAQYGGAAALGNAADVGELRTLIKDLEKQVR